jgi:hypothetical protein
LTAIKFYGGSERIVAWLVDELVKLGHDVTLFASGDSVTSARLEAARPRALRLGQPRCDSMAAHRFARSGFPASKRF